jgi:hypothetical protein
MANINVFNPARKYAIHCGNGNWIIEAESFKEAVKRFQEAWMGDRLDQGWQGTDDQESAFAIPEGNIYVDVERFCPGGAPPSWTIPEDEQGLAPPCGCIDDYGCGCSEDSGSTVLTYLEEEESVAEVEDKILAAKQAHEAAGRQKLLESWKKTKLASDAALSKLQEHLAVLNKQRNGASN